MKKFLLLVVFILSLNFSFSQRNNSWKFFENNKAVTSEKIRKTPYSVNQKLLEFNDLFFTLVNAVKDYFPTDPTISTAVKSLTAIRKMNPTLIYRVWVHYVDTPYKNQIQGSNIEFFVNKDYSEDLKVICSHYLN